MSAGSRRYGSSTSTPSDQRPLVAGDAMTFAPRFSPDGQRILFYDAMPAPIPTSMWPMPDGGPAQRLTSAPGIDTDASFSPDGSRIVFESDRSGTQQLYVMSADGSGQRRISFGGGWYAAPVWSPDGEWIAFTRRVPGAGLRIGVIKPDGSGERLLTAGPSDEGPSWAASGQELLFQRTGPDGRSALSGYRWSAASRAGSTTPQDASDPDWSGALD